MCVSVGPFKYLEGTVYELHMLWELNFADSFVKDAALGSKLC